MFNSTRPHASSSCALSELLNDHISAAEYCPIRARSEATISHTACPYSQSLDHLLTDRSATEEHKLVRLVLNSNIFNQEDQQQQEEEQGQKDINHNNDIEDCRQLQQEPKKDMAVVLITRKVGNTYPSSKKDESPRIANHDLSLESRQDKLGSFSDTCTNNKFNNNPESDEDHRRRSPTERKRPSLSSNGPTHKKPKHHLQQRFTSQSKPRSKSHRPCPKLHSLD
jgi:hypothetical protein